MIAPGRQTALAALALFALAGIPACIQPFDFWSSSPHDGISLVAGTIGGDVVDSMDPLPDVMTVPDMVVKDLPREIAEVTADLPLTFDVLEILGPHDVGEDVGPIVYPPCQQVEEAVGSTVAGMLYWDGDGSSASSHWQGCYPKYDTPMGAAEVHLIGEDHEWQTTSCENGEFAFDQLAHGTYVLDVQVDEQLDCTSANRPVRFPQAIREGKVTIVTIGDSVPKWGPSPRFPSRLAWHLRRLAEVDNRNVAVPGSKSMHWVPGTSYFENILAPELAEADVVVISIGGNDIMGYYGSAFSDWSKIYEKFKGLDDFLDGLHGNVEATVTEIRVRAPHVDVVFCLYFNYMEASYWQNMAGMWKALAVDAASQAFKKARLRLGELPGLVLADMFGAYDDDSLDAYLSDSVHLSALGHKVYAREILLALGGIIVGDVSHGTEPMFGFQPPE